MTSSTTSTVYVNVIEDVINKVREEFLNNGCPGESVLTELQGIWELKMMQAGAILGPIERSSATKSTTPGASVTPVHDLNVPYEGNEEYETPTAELLFPPTPIQTPLSGTVQTPLPGMVQTPLPGTAQTPLPGSADSSMYNIPTGGTSITPSDYTSVNDTAGVTDLKAGRPSQYMDFFMMSSGKRKREDFASQYQNGGFIPQQDGAGDAMSDDFQVSHTEGNIVTAANREVITQGVGLSSRIPQLDGPIPDPYDDVLSTPNIYNYQGGVVNEDYNIVNTPAPNDQAGTPAVVTQNDIGEDDDDEPLNENDDDDDLDDVDQGEELNTHHLVLAQFDKVTRTKSRWKCTLKDGIMHINNKDILFNKATGEFDF
ncbi:transcription initiation factor IIA large subunit-like isoform X2 [Camellia sinensis]|uniref:transcription initiation factor IIA large subunit-like isoform X2 n=1 Tax=Camellia sinensis TaxID=4442 RepID=UPI001035F728|nr:transcription initiation factor IIA large subunit-like isoform X2 [Camellia sinensis]